MNERLSYMTQLKLDELDKDWIIENTISDLVDLIFQQYKYHVLQWKNVPKKKTTAEELAHKYTDIIINPNLAPEKKYETLLVRNKYTSDIQINEKSLFNILWFDHKKVSYQPTPWIKEFSHLHIDNGNEYSPKRRKVWLNKVIFDTETLNSIWFLPGILHELWHEKAIWKWLRHNEEEIYARKYVYNAIKHVGVDISLPIESIARACLLTYHLSNCNIRNETYKKIYISDEI